MALHENDLKLSTKLKAYKLINGFYKAIVKTMFLIKNIPQNNN